MSLLFWSSECFSEGVLLCHSRWVGDQSERGCSLSLSTDSAEECRPELVLKGHTKEGYESWSSLTLSLEFCHFSFMFYFESCNTCFLNWTDRYGLSWNSSVQGHLLSASDDQVRLHHTGIFVQQLSMLCRTKMCRLCYVNLLLRQSVYGISVLPQR